MTLSASQYQWIVPLFASAANLWVCYFVYSRDKRSLVHQTFALMSVTLVLWNLDIFSLGYASTAAGALFWSRLFRVGMLLMPPTLLQFAVVFTGAKSKWLRWLLALNYAIATVLVVANSMDLLVSHVERLTWGYYPRPRPLYSLHTASFVVNAVVAFGVLAHASWYGPSARVRLQARFWLLGLAIAGPLGVTNLLAVYGVPVYPLGSLASVAFTGVVAYAIVRHRLMDIDLVVTKGVAYASVAFVLVAPAFLLTLWFERLAFGTIHPNFSSALLIMLIAVGVFFPTLRLRAQSRIEQSLFREKHEHRAALIAFTRSIVRILDSDRLLRELASSLSETLGLERISIALSDEPRHLFSIRHTLGAAFAAEDLSDHHELILALVRGHGAVLRDELEVSSDAADRKAAVACVRNGWEACIPLTVGSNLIGFIGLGRKRNLDTFFAEDLELLETLAAEASVALENARLYEELKKSQDIIRRADRLSALGTLAAGIAHEVRNPLVSIQTFFQLAPDRLHDEEFLTTFLSMTASEVKRIADLITELLSFARSPTRSLGGVNLTEVVDRVVTLLEPEARKHKLTLAQQTSEGAPLVRADGDQIKQVLINLVLNAIQATPPTGVVTVSVSSAQRAGRTFGQLQIQDNGTGIPQEAIDHIFDPFFSTKDKGTGLGLAIAHQIVMEHGGFLSVESVEGRGTSFFVDLPALDQTIEPGPPAAQSLESDSLPIRYERLRKVAS